MGAWALGAMSMAQPVGAEKQVADPDDREFPPVWFGFNGGFTTTFQLGAHPLLPPSHILTCPQRPFAIGAVEATGHPTQQRPQPREHPDGAQAAPQLVGYGSYEPAGPAVASCAALSNSRVHTLTAAEPAQARSWARGRTG